MTAGNDDLLDQLRRGRGDAVRALLAMPREAAGEVLLDCLCSPDPRSQLVAQCEGYVELLLAIAPPLERWFAHIAAMSVECTEDELLFPLRMLRIAGERGEARCAAFLIEQVEHGVHWRRALSEFLDEGTPLPDAVWQRVLSRVTEEDLRLFVRDDEEWRGRAENWPVVAASLAHERERVASWQWSPANVRAADGPHRRAKLLLEGLEVAPAEVAPHLVEGLWDGSAQVRLTCIQHVDRRSPGVDARLRELRERGSAPCVEAARQRLVEPDSAGALAAGPSRFVAIPDADELRRALRFGRGDAVRTLLGWPRERTAALLVELLVDDQGLCELAVYGEGLGELVEACDVSLTPLFDRLRDLDAAAWRAEGQHDHRLEHARDLLVAFAARGSAECVRFLAERGLDDAALHPPRVPVRWSNDDLEAYQQAPRSSTRWQVVKRALADAPEHAARWLFEGLWDASPYCRGYCIDKVDLTLPGARERIEQLASSRNRELAGKARRRLATSS